MNREALEYLFENMDCSWGDMREIDDYDGDGYILRTSRLSKEEIGEIRACNAGLESIQNQWFKVFDDEDEYQIFNPE